MFSSHDVLEETLLIVSAFIVTFWRKTTSPDEEPLYIENFLMVYSIILTIYDKKKNKEMFQELDGVIQHILT